MNKQNNKEILTRIERGEANLKHIAGLLKQDFVGLDTIIDSIIENIKLWYIFPEMQIRPTIVCLWGLTGVGKTDLIRKLVGYLKMQDRFIEIEMSGSEDSSKSIQNKLETSSVTAEEPSILFLDEIQKFRTLDEVTGTALNKASGYNDLWTLLSDGKFQSNLQQKTEIIESLLNAKYYKDLFADDKKSESPAEKEQKKSARMYKTPVYLARRVKRMFRLKESIEDIMKWDEAQIYDLQNSFASSPEVFESESYSKMLIIISGNLDEAYTMAIQVGDADVDADFYHERSKKLTIINIKNALNKRFKPEQIARFGNNHVIYPALSKNNFYEIIRRKCTQISNLIFEKTAIQIAYDDSVYDMMYRNGVFPTQGVRPLLSTITGILSNALPMFIFNGILHSKKKLVISYENEQLHTTIKKQKFSIKIPTVLDSIRKAPDAEMRSVVLVHEMGHAMVYSLLFNSVPKQICISSVSPFSNGYIMPEQKISTKENLLNDIMVLFAGRCAEELVFGEAYSTVGASSDIAEASSDALNYVNKYGFHNVNGRHSAKFEDAWVFDQTPEQSAQIEALLTEMKHKCSKLIFKNMKLFKALLVLGKGSQEIDMDAYKKCFANHQIHLQNKYTSNFAKKLDMFVNNDVAYVNMFPETKKAITV